MNTDGKIQDIMDGNILISVKKIVFRRCTPEWVMPPHVHRYENLTLLMAGEADYTLGSEHVHVSQGDLLCVGRGVFRQAKQDLANPMRCYSIDYLMTDAAGSPVSLPMPLVSRPGRMAVITDLFHRLSVCWLQQNSCTPLRVKGLLQLLLYNLLTGMTDADSARSASDERIRSMMDHISRHYSESLQLEEYARRYGLNKVYLGTLFRKTAGTTFHQYLLSARLNAADDLLYTGKYTVSEVAYMTGFQDPAYFNRMYSRRFQQSPGRQRLAAKPPEPRP